MGSRDELARRADYLGRALRDGAQGMRSGPVKKSSNDSLSARLKELPGGSFLNLRSVPPFAVGATLAVLAAG